MTNTETRVSVKTPFFAYRRSNDRMPMEPIGPHRVANRQTAAILRLLPVVRDEQTEAA